MNLVIVESPTKAKTIGKFLGKEYEIKASMGHVMDLPKSKIGVALETDFAPQYELIADKKNIIAELRSIAKTATSIFLATDPDREGEAIASHVKEMLIAGNKKLTKQDLFKRVVFHEITKEAIQESFEHPRAVDDHLVDAQTARRVLDRLVGYKLSPLLWQKVRRGLSAGRVQSIALRLIVEREREIEKFKKENYWTVTVFFEEKSQVIVNAVKQAPRNDNLAAPFALIEMNRQKIDQSEVFNLYDGEYKVGKTTIDTKEKAQDIVSDLQPKTFVVSDVQQKETRRSPQPPYTTSTLQQDASRRFGYSGKKTMSLAQKLYEEGHITYHRTDSVAMAASAVTAMRSFAQKTYGEKYVPESPKLYTAKQKLAQEAHEAIRPTRVTSSSDAIAQDMGRDYAKLYELIWKRAVASQMSDALIESTTVLVETDDKKYLFKANGSVLVFDGFLKVNPQALQDTRLPQYAAQEKLKLADIQAVPHETPPPPRYNDASLIRTLEEKGIGRPSTYATIIGTIQDRQYIVKEENRFSPTSVGIAVNDFLVANFSDIDDIPFTAQMEDELDNIANGKRAWVPMMKEFYKPFAKKLEEVKGVERIKIEVEVTDQKCEKCGELLVVRLGKFGKFLSCSTFPTCDFKKPFLEETNVTCPKDSGRVIIKKTRKGRRFYGCSNYPNCDFAAWKLEEIGKAAVAADRKTKIVSKKPKKS